MCVMFSCTLSLANDRFQYASKLVKSTVCWRMKLLVQQYLFPGERHWRMSHTGGIVNFLHDGFPCGNCGKIYKHRGNMRRHMVYECGKQARFECNFCARKFHQQSNLKRHCETQHRIPNNRYLTVVPLKFDVS